MSKRSLSVASGLCLAALLLLTAPVAASDGGLDRNTLVFFSTDSWSGMRQAFDNSDSGRMLKDPEIQQTWRRLEGGLTALVKAGIEDAAGGDADQIKAATDVLQGYFSTLYDKVTGRAAFSFGFVEIEGNLQPELMVHLQGGEEIGQQNGKIIEFLQGMLQGSPLAPADFELAGAKFKGFANQMQMPPQAGVMVPDGLFFGNKGSDYYIGISKAGLQNYIENKGARLGAEPEYRKAHAATGAGQMRFFVNVPALWRLFDRYSPMMGRDAEEVTTVIDALGLRAVGAFLASWNATPAGIESRAFVGLSGRPGLMKLIPVSNTSLEMPPYVSSDVLSSGIARLELSQVLDMALDIAVKLEGESAREEFEEGMGEFEEEMGMKLSDLFGALEGSILSITAGGEGGGLASMMGGGLPPQIENLVIGLRLKDASVATTFLDKMKAHEEIGSVMKTEEFLGRKMHVFKDDDAPEFGMVPTPAVVVDKDWFLFGLSPKGVQAALKTAYEEGQNRLKDDASYKKAFGPIGTSGIAVGFVDNARYMGDMADMVRGLIGALPFMAPDLAQDEMLFLFDPANIPSRKVIDKYFGKTAQVISNTDGGIVIKSWQPSVSGGAKKKL